MHNHVTYKKECHMFIDSDYIPTELKIGTLYHCAWANSRGCVWKLTGILNNNQVELTTPKTGRVITTNQFDLRLTNKDAKVKALARLQKTNP